MIKPHPLLPKLKELRLGGMVHTLESRAREAMDKSMSHVEFLALLLDDEIDRRHHNRYRRHIEQSRLDETKSLESFDFAAVPWLSRTLVNDLATCRFVERAENLLLAGPTGTGKTHLAHALGLEAIKRELRVLCRPVHQMLSRLHAGRADGSHGRYWSRLLRVDLLILDDFGLVPLTAQSAEDLYELIRKRYERGSIIITSNRAPEEWDAVFGNQLMASAALDRLTHHSRFIEMRGESYRQRERRLRNDSFIKTGEKTGEEEEAKQSANQASVNTERGGDI